MQTSPADVVATAQPKPPSRTPARSWGFAVLVAVLVVAATGYVGWARARDRPQPGSGDAAITGAPAVLFQNLAPPGTGQVAVANLGDPDHSRRLAILRCDRVHYAAGHGLCLVYEGFTFPPVPQAMIFGANFRVTKKIPLDGVPSRARVSPDGRYGATTSFVTGHSYIDRSFSTSTTLIDMARGTTVANLEQFTVIRDGRPYTASDVNFWGVTFANDSNRFFATLRTRDRNYLVEGDIAARRVVVKRENVECPSLSPDGTRIGYKKRVNQDSASPRWRFHVLDLASGQETPVAEARSVDDQLEWLDDKTLLYGGFASSDTVMAVPADGTGEPRRFLSQARSPTVLRTPLPDRAITGLATGPQLVRANLGVTIAAPAAAVPGKPLVHTITVTNHGPGPATNVSIEDQLSGPGSITSADARPSREVNYYGCTTMPDEARARCNVATLPAGVTWTMTVTIVPTRPGDLDAKALVAAAEPDPVNDNDIATTRTRAG
jgi:uncharacterized repeat protein (TIGR01451 family)